MTPLRTLALTLAVPLLVPATALAAGDAPGETIVQTSETVKKVVGEAADHAKMVASLRATLAAIVDYDGFSQRTLKTSWPTLTPEDQARFKEKFEALIIATYAKRFKVGATFGFERRGATEYRGDAKTQAFVRTTVSGDKASADVDYLLKATDGAWRVIDIEIDEVSMARNWRKQFEKIIAKKGFDVLLDKIDKQVAKRNAGK